MALVVVGAAIVLVVLLQSSVTSRDVKPALGVSHGGAQQSAPIIDPEIERLSSKADVDTYVGKLVADVKRRGNVQRQDFENGRLAIARLRGLLPEPEVQARTRLFGEELALLQRSLAYKPIVDELDELAAGIERSSDVKVRADLASKYREAVQGLPPNARQHALSRLAMLDKR